MPIVDKRPNRGLITRLEPGAPYLRDLQDNFNKVFCFADARVTSIYETKKSATVKVRRRAKFLVDMTNVFT